MAGEYSIGKIYQGGYSSLDSEYGQPATSPARFGVTTDPRMANQLAQVSAKLATGAVPIEMGILQPETFEAMPKQQFKEINRIAELTGAKISMHAPFIGKDPSGIGQQGGWTEEDRMLGERVLIDAMDKAAILDESGTMPVTVHSGGFQGTTWKKTAEGKITEEKLVLIDQETGQLRPIQEDTKYYPSSEGATIHEPRKQIETINHTKWSDEIMQAVTMKENADRIISENWPLVEHVIEDIYTGKIDPNSLTPTQQNAWSRYNTAKTYLSETNMKISGLFNKAYQYAPGETPKEKEKVQKELAELAKNFRQNFGHPEESRIPEPGKPVKNPYTEEEWRELQTKRFSLTNQSKAMQIMLAQLEQVTPEVFKPVEDFAIEKSSETFSNVALHAYKEHKNAAPILSIENLYPGMGLSRAEDMNKLIVESKKAFVKKATDEGLMNKTEAEKYADAKIGATLDVGHLNVHKKSGFEDKDLIKEVGKIAEHVKHVHITDNFGFSDSHLPPGMGNVPIKELMKELEKKGYSGRQILEAGGWFEHFKSDPYELALQGMGAQMSGLPGEAPYWNQATALYQGYHGGMGNMLPQTHYGMFGAGFSQLPSELGGSTGQGAQGSRMSGRGME